MQINASSLRDLYSGFNVSFNKGLNNAATHWQTVAMKIPSTGASENYAWLEDLPGVREWLGDRVVHSLGAANYVIRNREFELTIAVKRTQIEDDQYGVYGPLIEKMGHDTAIMPDKLTFGLLKNGFVERGYDLSPFFHDEHLGFDEAGKEKSVSNLGAGAGPAWYLLDCSQPIRPLIYQERKPFQFVSFTNPTDPNVFWKGEYVYGTDGRSNAGYGLWQLAYGSKATLNDASYTEARTAMAALRKQSGEPLGITPTHLLVPSSMERTARQLIHAELVNGGESNVWAKSVELIVSPFLS